MVKVFVIAFFAAAFLYNKPVAYAGNTRAYKNKNKS